MHPVAPLFIGRCLIAYAAVVTVAASCAAPRPAAPPAPIGLASLSAAPAQANAQGTGAVPMQVGPTGLTLPLALAPQSLPERQFAVAASRAMRQIYDEDHDDAALVEALLPRLQHGELAALAAVWSPLLEAARLRAEALAAIAPGLRALRRAYAEAYYDEMAQGWRQLDADACRQSQNLLAGYAAAHADFVVTIEPVGPWPLAKLLRTCRT